VSRALVLRCCALVLLCLPTGHILHIALTIACPSAQASAGDVRIIGDKEKPKHDLPTGQDRTSATVYRCGSTAGATGPTAFLPPGKKCSDTRHADTRRAVNTRCADTRRATCRATYRAGPCHLHRPSYPRSPGRADCRSVNHGILPHHITSATPHHTAPHHYWRWISSPGRGVGSGLSDLGNPSLWPSGSGWATSLPRSTTPHRTTPHHITVFSFWLVFGRFLFQKCVCEMGACLNSVG
jgi:hypothetical protein